MAKYEERLAEAAAESFLRLPPEGQEKVKGLIESIRESPVVDDERVFELKTKPVSFRVLVDPDYTVYFRLEGDQVWIYTIQETSPDVRLAATADYGPSIRKTPAFTKLSS
jgi:hypothetical protein